MNRIAKLAFGTLLLMGTAAAVSTPASAGVGVSFGWGGPGYVPFADPCAYYDYYDAPPPWGLPPDYCEYPIYFGEVYWGDTWYRGPIYYRWVNGSRMYWINGGWRRHQWHGGARPHIRWNDRGGWGRHPHGGPGYRDRGPRGGGPGHGGPGYRDRGPRGGGPGHSGRGGGSRGGGPGHGGGGGHGGRGGGGGGGGGHGGHGGHRGGR